MKYVIYYFNHPSLNHETIPTVKVQYRVLFIIQYSYGFKIIQTINPIKVLQTVLSICIGTTVARNSGTKGGAIGENRQISVWDTELGHNGISIAVPLPPYLLYPPVTHRHRARPIHQSSYLSKQLIIIRQPWDRLFLPRLKQNQSNLTLS